MRPLTLGVEANLVKRMKISEVQMKRLVRSVFNELQTHNAIVVKAPDAQVLKRGEAALLEEFAQERQLDEDVNKMLDDLERKTPGEFQRHKMFLMLKRKLAEERGIVL
jgi:hypothetical protein